MDRHSAYVALSRHRDGVQLHYGRDDFADDRRLVRTLGRERAKDMASDYPMYRDRDAEAQSFADRRGLSGEIRVADAPERKGEILAPRAGTSRQMGEDPARPIGGGRGAGEAKAAAERQPRRGMFDGFRPAPAPGGRARPGRQAEARHVRRLEAVGRAGDARSARRRPERGQDRTFARGRADLAFGRAVLQARASGGPVLEHQKVALERATQALDQIRPGASRDLASAMQRDPALLRDAAAGRSGPMIEAMAQEARVRADPNLRADRFVERWQQLSQDRDRLYRAGDMTGREKAGRKWRAWRKALSAIPGGIDPARRSRELGLEIGMSRAAILAASYRGIWASATIGD
jgi:hypothetical protein